MKNMKRFLSMALVLCLALGLFVGCQTLDVPTLPATQKPTNNNNTPTGTQGGTQTPTEPVDLLTFAPGTVLRMACGYNNKKTGLFFDAEVAKDGITLADGKTYHAGELKPTWVEVQNRLGMVFEDKYQGNSATNELKFWAEKLHEVDMVAGNTTGLNERGAAGQLVNIAEYLDMMPNFKAYLEANPIVRVAITGTDANGELGAIYFSPYFDGVSDIERMPLMRTDWVEKLLNGEGEFTATASGTLSAAVYTPYMPTSGKVVVDVVNLDGTAVETVTKNYDAAGNITDAPDSCFAYDTNNRLTWYNGDAVSYDADGNMLSVVLNGTTGTTFTYDSANRLISSGGHTYTYNAEDVGIRNLCAGEDTKYTYNTNCRLSKLLW